MTDTENGPDASGSWQPDPTGRFRLRWRRDTGEWTNHVYSSEGALGNDPYDTPPVPRPPTPANEKLSDGHQPTMGAQRPRLSRGKKLLIVLGIIVALFIVSGIVGGLVELDSDTTSGTSSQPTETTLKPAPAQTSPPPDTEADCTRKIGRATTLAAQWLNEAETVMTGDFNSATLAYDIAILTYDDMQDANLAAFACNLEREWYEESERWADLATTAQNLKAELHYACSTELEPRGFECGS